MCLTASSTYKSVAITEWLALPIAIRTARVRVLVRPTAKSYKKLIFLITVAPRRWVSSPPNVFLTWVSNVFPKFYIFSTHLISLRSRRRAYIFCHFRWFCHEFHCRRRPTFFLRFIGNDVTMAKLWICFIENFRISFTNVFLWDSKKY